MPVSAVAQPADPVRGPGHHVGYGGSQRLLASWAHVMTCVISACDVTHKPGAVGMFFASFDAADGTGKVEFAFVASSTVGPRHEDMMAGRG
ncbi:hypothetical protein KEM60_00748 [Austwickia sp. TVS 96-490-7B]|nr:hypothetical protein [Austwickia sp. TVS 96-490-7B]